MNKYFFLACCIVVSASIGACTSTPQSVLTTSSQLIESRRTSAEQHLRALKSHKANLQHYAENLSVIERQIDAQSQSYARQAQYLQNMKRDYLVQKGLALFDSESLSWMNTELGKAIEGPKYWGVISQQFYLIKEKESAAKNHLIDAPGNELFRTEYRKYGIHAENLLKVGFKEEALIRSEVISMLKVQRKEFEKKLASMVAVNSIQGFRNQGFKNWLAKEKALIDALVIVIDQHIEDTLKANDAELDALQSLSEYLNRPSVIKEIGVGVAGELKENLKNILKEVPAKLGLNDNKLSILSDLVNFDQIYSQLEGQVDKEVDKFINKVEARIDNAREKVLNKSETVSQTAETSV